jgi:hypothetical protein
MVSHDVRGAGFFAGAALVCRFSAPFAPDAEERGSNGQRGARIVLLTCSGTGAAVCIFSQPHGHLAHPAMATRTMPAPSRRAMLR